MNYAAATRMARLCRRVRGYLGPEAIYLLAMLDEIQRAHSVAGSFFEIGTFEGKSLLLLAAIKRDHEQLGFCEASAEYLQSAERNLRRYASAKVADSVRAFGKFSSQLTRDDLAPPCRMIHIDGSHESADVKGDLHLAESTIDDRGVVIMDDVFNETYPGVVDGLYNFHAASSGALTPVVQGFGKTILCRAAARSMYFDWFTERNWSGFLAPKHFPTRITQFLGQDVFVFEQDLARRIRYHLFGGYFY
jgi:predicted O-methyltransferase YrrM